MPFDLEVNGQVIVEGVVYRIGEHPQAPGMPYTVEGLHSRVYQLTTGQHKQRFALKVFHPQHRTLSLVSQASQLSSFADLPGLQVCRRTVLAPQRHPMLLRQHPELSYAVLMPWIEGPTWQEFMLERKGLTPEESLRLARGLATVLEGLEQRRAAHCELSSDNLLLPTMSSASPDQSSNVPGVLSSNGSPNADDETDSLITTSVELVDVEQMFAPMLSRPKSLPNGSAGYAHKARSSLWAAEADRFAGAVLLAEILGWCDERVRDKAWGASYFESGEMQEDNARYALLINALRVQWGDPIASLFEQVWKSESLSGCPSLGEWRAGLSALTIQVASSSSVLSQVDPQHPPGGITPGSGHDSAVDVASAHTLVDIAAEAELAGDVVGALAAYNQARALLSPESALTQQIEAAIHDLQSKQQLADGEATPQMAASQVSVTTPIPSNPGPILAAIPTASAPLPLPRTHNQQRRVWALAPLLVLLTIGGFWVVTTLRAQQEAAQAQATQTAQAQATGTVRAIEVSMAEATTVALHADETATARSLEAAQIATATAEWLRTLGEAQATGTAYAQETKVSAREATAIAQVWATSTAQTMQTAVARNDQATIEARNRPPSSTPSLPVSGEPRGRIAFASDRDDPKQAHIYIVNADSSGERRLTSGSGYNFYPDWSPDGRTIAYHHGPNRGCDNVNVPAGDIFTIDVYTLQTRQLTSGRCARGPKWSPDGGYLLFSDAPDDQLTSYDIYIMTADGRNLRRLTTEEGFDGQPSWTPDGKIIFISERDKLNADDNDIYIMNSDGSEQRRLTYTAGEKRNPSVSPSGGRIVFASGRDDIWNIYTTTINGDDTERVTSQPGRNLFPTWSPDGRWIAYHSNPNAPENYNIYVVSSGGGSPRRVTTGSGYDTGPAWER